MFEKATRQKLRFSYRGVCTVEDLWDLTLPDLDSLFKDLNLELNEHRGVSLLKERNPQEKVLELKISIVKHIFSIMEAEILAANTELEKAQRKQKLLSKIAEKQDAALDEMSVEELIKEIDKL